LIKLPNVKLVLTNVVLVLITLLVLNVVPTEPIFQFVTVKKDTMNKLKFVTNVPTDVSVVLMTMIIVLIVLISEKLYQPVPVQ
jgi:uncharacterized membrane protein